MKENKIDNNCKNCSFCAKHYIIHNSMLLDSGGFHCTNYNLKVGEKKNRIENKVPCEYWQPMEVKIDKRKKKALKIYYTTSLKD